MALESKVKKENPRLAQWAPFFIGTYIALQGDWKKPSVLDNDHLFLGFVNTGYQLATTCGAVWGILEYIDKF